jgi:hypothetical protein
MGSPLKSGSQLTPRWRRESRANSSLKAKFPASREFTGNFIESGLGGASTAAKKDIKPKPYRPIAYASEQGIFYDLAGNLNQRSGKFPPSSRNPALVRYLGAFWPCRPIRSTDPSERSRPLAEKDKLCGTSRAVDRCTRRDQPKAGRDRPLHVGALGTPDGLEALKGLALVFKPEE